MEVKQILKQRGERYGKYSNVSWTAQRLKETMRDSYNWREMKLHWTQKESLDLICNKLARILNGDSNYKDSWVDIAGYAQLVVDELDKQTNF